MADSDNDSGGPHGGGSSAHDSEMSTSEKGKFLPIANVSRIMKKALPSKAKISKDAKRNGSRVRFRVHQLRHRRSLRQVPTREAEDDQQRRFALGYDNGLGCWWSGVCNGFQVGSPADV